MIPAFPVYIFDVDGTLVDSAPDICGAQRDVLMANGIHGVEDEFLRRYIGRHLIELFRDLGVAEARIDDLVQHYRRIYPERKHALTCTYPGVAEMLAALGGRKSTATIKSTKNTRVVLEQFGLIAHFDHVQGTDGFPAKPEPDVLLKTVELFGVRPEQCLFVGDAASDMEAGRRAGMPTCGVRWGYGNHEQMAKWSPDYWIDRPADLMRAEHER